MKDFKEILEKGLNEKWVDLDAKELKKLKVGDVIKHNKTLVTITGTNEKGEYGNGYISYKDNKTGSITNGVSVALMTYYSKGKHKFQVEEKK